LRAIDERASTCVERLSFGTAYFCPQLPTVWVRNFVWVEAAVDDMELAQVVREAEELHAGVGVRHRRIVFADEDSGSRAAALLGPSGWRVRADRLMVYRGSAAAMPDSPQVVEVAPGALRQASAVAYREHPDVQSEETVEHLLLADELLAEATTERCFAWLEGGAVTSYCRLFSDGETAQVEDVGTLSAFRQRGHARAVVSKALRAGAESHGLTFLLAADDGWPKRWYARLGFEEVGLLRELVMT
jgi:ribosomal protein S18 acetylase RimI-like enzyme